MNDDKPDWFETLSEWFEQHHERATVYFLVALVVGIVLTRHVAQLNREQAQRDKDGVEIERHMSWLRSLPETEKRAWPVHDYCRPSSAYLGKCKCDVDDDSVVTWPERLENGDVACHAQK